MYDITAIYSVGGLLLIPFFYGNFPGDFYGIVEKHNSNFLLTKKEVFTRKSQMETLPCWQSDSEVNTARQRSEISLLRSNVRG